MTQSSNWCLVGIPDDQGVAHVGGRVGAAQGPAAFRSYFEKLNGRSDIRALGRDWGDVSPISADIDANHRHAIDKIAQAHSSATTSVVVGGGHDHGYTHLAGIKKSLGGRIGCMNIDAHLDVRKPSPKITSGSPFYLAIENQVLRPNHLVEFGVQKHCNRPELWEYARSKRIPVVRFEKLRFDRHLVEFRKHLRKLTRACDSVVISLDLDAIACRDCPGVSAPQAEGFSSSAALEMVDLAGREAKVVSLGIFELNPSVDRDGQSARFAATLAYHFLEAKITSGKSGSTPKDF